MIRKLTIGNYRMNVDFVEKGDRIYIYFPFHKAMKDEIASLEGAKWHGFDELNPVKAWSIPKPISARNQFTLDFLEGKNPYARYQAPLDSIKVHVRPELTPFPHQIEMAQHAIRGRGTIIAGEMGTGKSLASILAAETLMNGKYMKWWYVGPKAGRIAYLRELKKWGCPFVPEVMTYEELTKRLQTNAINEPPPRIFVIDECSKVKTPTAKRSQACLHVANEMRRTYGDECLIMELSGTPAPRDPTDWWHLCEVACPGFIKEGHIMKFKKRLAIIRQETGLMGQVFPRVVSWLDDESKCAECGQPRSHADHELEFMAESHFHTFKPSVNEVAKLYRRMQGLVMVKFKKDCLNLPEKQHIILRVKPTHEMLKAAQMIVATAPRAAQKLIWLRELSDGFLYTTRQIGTKPCSVCDGSGRIAIPEDDVCPACDGTTQEPEYERGTDTCETPKDQVFIDQLDEHEDIGRYVVWGAFTETIDKLSRIAREQGWHVLVVDGRGYRGFTPDGMSVDYNELLDAMDQSHPRRRECLIKYPKLCFVGHPKAGGMALTLTASPTALYYSNDYSGEGRMQSEDRIHRAGMDTNRNCNIIDLFCLPTDELVFKNLDNKKFLQALSLGDLTASLHDGSAKGVNNE